MARITWISAVQEYNARNKTKVKGKKGSPEYPAIKKIFEELKAGTTKRTEPAKKKEAKKVKLSGGESIEIECEGGEIKVRETKQPPPPKTQEKKEQEQKKYEEEKKVFDEDLDKKIIPILEEQSQLQKKYERLAYQERLLEYEGGGDAKRYDNMTKLFDKIKKLGDKLKPILKEAGISKSPYSMFKEDYKTYKKFDVDTLDMSERKANRIIEKKEAAERKRQQEKEEEEEENYGILDIEAISLENDRERMKNMSVEEKMAFMKDKEKAISDRSRGLGRPQETQEEKDERRRKLGVPLESEEPKKEVKKREKKETKEQKRAREDEELKKKYIEEQRRATIRGGERGEQERAERTKLRGPSWQVIHSLFYGGRLDDIKKGYDEGKFTLKNIQDFIKDEKNADKDKISKLQRLVKECSYNEIEEFRRCVSDLKDKLTKRTNSAETINNILESFKHDFLTNDYDRFNLWCKSLRYLRERKCKDEIKKVKDLMLYVKNNEMKAGKKKFKMIDMRPVNEILEAIEGKTPEPEETKEDILNIFERKGLVEELTEDDPDLMEYAELEAEEKAPPKYKEEMGDLLWGCIRTWKDDPTINKKSSIKQKNEYMNDHLFCISSIIKYFKSLSIDPENIEVPEYEKSKHPRLVELYYKIKNLIETDANGAYSKTSKTWKKNKDLYLKIIKMYEDQGKPGFPDIKQEEKKTEKPEEKMPPLEDDPRRKPKQEKMPPLEDDPTRKPKKKEVKKKEVKSKEPQPTEKLEESRPPPMCEGKKCMEEKMPLLKQVVISKTQSKREETKKEEPKKRDLKSKLERLRNRLCPSDDIDKKDIHFDDTKTEAEINKKLRKLAARLHPDKNPDCEEEAEEKFKYLQEQKERKIREFAEESGEEVSEFSKLSKLYADFYAKYEEFKKNEKDEKIRKELLKMFKKVKKVYNEEYEGIGIQENFLLGVVLERMVTLAEKVRKDLMRTHKKTKK